jgi:hypothetical protein
LDEEAETMATDDRVDAPERQHRKAALTPLPVRLLLIGHVKPGAETSLREIQMAFPFAAAAEAGISAVEAYIGSGYYAVELEIEGDDTQANLAAFFSDPRVREFRDRLESVVENLPGPEFQFGVGDHFHQEADNTSEPERSQKVLHTGDLPFAASMYRWRVDEAPQTGAEPHGRLESRPRGAASGAR